MTLLGRLNPDPRLSYQLFELPIRMLSRGLLDRPKPAAVKCHGCVPQTGVANLKWLTLTAAGHAILPDLESSAHQLTGITLTEVWPEIDMLKSPVHAAHNNTQPSIVPNRASVALMQHLLVKRYQGVHTQHIQTDIAAAHTLHTCGLLYRSWINSRQGCHRLAMTELLLSKCRVQPLLLTNLNLTAPRQLLPLLLVLLL